MSMIKNLLNLLGEIWNKIKPSEKFWQELDDWSRENGYW